MHWWQSAVFPSPMADFSYNIADYAGIDPLFGSLADFDVPVALNFGAYPATVALPPQGAGGTILLASDAEREGESVGRSLALGAHAGAVAALTARPGR